MATEYVVTDCNWACEHLSTDCNCPSLGNRACEHTETPRNMSATLDRATPSMVQRTSLNQRGWSSKGDKDRERDVQQNECTNGDTAATEHNRANHDIPDGWKPASRDIPHATTTPIPTTNKHHTMLEALLLLCQCVSLSLSRSLVLSRSPSRCIYQSLGTPTSP